jgi:ABC-type sugar transport system ATPase subunit
MGPTDPAIETENPVKIHRAKSAHPVRALDCLSLSVKQGEIFGFLAFLAAVRTLQRGIVQ